jgi:hypothetical protein
MNLVNKPHPDDSRKSLTKNFETSAHSGPLESDSCDGSRYAKGRTMSSEALNVVSLTDFYSIIGGSRREATEIFYYGDKGAYIHSRNMAAAFAMAVTVHTEPGCGWLARNGEESIFKTLYRIYPEVCMKHFKRNQAVLSKNIY